MGMFDYIRVDPAVIPPWTSAMSRSAYRSEVAKVTSAYGCQTKQMMLTMDAYEITADGWLIRTSDHWKGLVHRLSLYEIQCLEAEEPVPGRPGCWYVSSYSGTLCPGDRMEFVVEHGRLVHAGIHPVVPSADDFCLPRAQRKARRAQQMARHHGSSTRRGRKWARVVRKRLSHQPKIPVMDEAHQFLGGAVTPACMDMIRLMRHAGPTVPFAQMQV